MPGTGTPGGGVTVTRSTLRQQIADALRDEALAGRLSPGQEFTVKEIAEQYGVSATPVREALVDLAGQGLLDSDQHRGFRVHEFTVADYRNMIEARSFIAEGIFRRCAEDGMRPPRDPRVMVSVRRRAAEAERAATAGDLNVLVGYDIRFWREVGALVDNSYVSDFLHRIRVHCWVFAVPYLRREPDLRGRLWAGHGALADAIAQCDGETARAVVAEHNRHARRLVDDLAGE
ncbi:GntR family transcriptional regulator [Streptomyces sp. GC420]|uniref:GntR family transcriptional regulator n=1 Tax=Streptomyces sp. GC420 TaxID=2697568 RepID=UPI001414E7AD|nr:GntR family transcriptional regulator [Streptomyces sp. GC420]NBM20085.1 GntR family transcriptional regulator [Streptomyces sp. GC420]